MATVARTCLFLTSAVAIDGERSSDVALRRRERRLRAWQRHVCAYGGAAGSRGDAPPQREQGGAGQRPTGTGEESWQGGGRARDALWPAGTDAPASGDAAGAELPGPQRCDRTVRGTSQGSPLLEVQSLRGADGIDDTAVKLLLQLALKKKKEEEDEEEEEEEEEGWGG